MQEVIFSISACHFSESQFWLGALLNIKDIRAHWLMVMSMGQGMQ